MYPLPLASQEDYTKWFRHKITKGKLKNYVIKWCGKQLTKRFKFENVIIESKNIFICQLEDKYEYIIIDKNQDIFKLPKKYYTNCFPGIHYINVPSNNRMEVNISNSIKVVLPVIPQSFLDSKKIKTRKRRRIMTSSTVATEQMNFDQRYPKWHVLENTQNNECLHKEMMLLVRSIVKYADKNHNYKLFDPFKEVDSIQNIKKSKKLLHMLKIVCGFVYHHCKSELGIVDDTTTDATEWLLKMNSEE